MIDRNHLLQIVREAARIAHSRWPGDGNSCEVWEKSPGNPVCEGDIAVDRFLRRELSALLPSAAWLSEETTDNKARVSAGLVWLVDPIDGTRDFVNGRDGWAVSVALVSAGRPLIGILAAPARCEEWVGEAGNGATLNDTRIAASTRTQYEGARVPADQLPAGVKDLAMVDKPNSIALRIAMIADDRADLVATMRWGFEWDIAAAALIAREAGAQVSDADGNSLAFNKHDPRDFGVLVSAPGIHAEALKRISRRARAARD